MTSPTLGSAPCSPLGAAAYARFISMCPLLAQVQQGGVVADTLRMQQGHTRPQEQFPGAPAPLPALDLIGINSSDPEQPKYSNALSHWGLRLYHCPHFGLSCAPLLPILSVNVAGKG